MRPVVESQPFLAVLRGERPEHRPIWIMRQAGRYLPEYQALRADHSFVDICKTPELACEATLQPIRRYGFDAAILFNDILVPLEPMGTSFAFTDSGPRLEKPVRRQEDIASLRSFEPNEDLSNIADAIRLLKTELNGTPLIGFAGAPFTLATYLVEGGGNGNCRNVKNLMYRRPELLQTLLDKLSDQIARYLRMQIDAGADAVQLFDTWAGILSPADYERFVLPGIQRIFASLADTGAPTILFLKGGASFLHLLDQCGASTVSLDWTVDIPTALKHLGDKHIQGNLDPLALYAPHDEIRRRAHAICAAGDSAMGHIFNLGHGILPDAPLDGVEALVQAVHEYKPGASA